MTDDFRSGCRNVSQMSPQTVLLRTTLTRTITLSRLYLAPDLIRFVKKKEEK